ncbi:class I SAM-dependent methyltransferase [Streptomyces lydicus]|nr:class I SAM-dependent methyltransferase [Streptomyces lydicus]
MPPPRSAAGSVPSSAPAVQPWADNNRTGVKNEPGLTFSAGPARPPCGRQDEPYGRQDEPYGRQDEPNDGQDEPYAAPHPRGATSPDGTVVAAVPATGPRHPRPFLRRGGRPVRRRPPRLSAGPLRRRRGAGRSVAGRGAGAGRRSRDRYRDRAAGRARAQVTAVEPGAAMAAELHAAHPGTPLVRALGDALPFSDEAGFDLVSYAQAWHWTDPARSVPEALRVLRPGGALALWWNIPDPDVGWAAEQEARLARRLLGYHRHGVAPEAPDLLRGLGLGLEPAFRVLHWTRRVPLDTHLAMLGSRSHFSAIGPAAAAPVLEDERTALLSLFPDGIVEEAYALDLTVTLRPPAAGEPEAARR